MLDIAPLDVTSTARLTQREWPPWCSKLCRWTSENGVTRWGFCSTKLSRNCALSLWHVVTAIVIALRSLIKTESRTAKLQQVSRFTLPRLNWQMKQRMNEPIFGLLLSASLSLLDSFFPSGLLLRKKLSARRCMLSFRSMLALKFQGTWIVPSNDPFLHKQTSEKKNSTRTLLFRVSSWNLFLHIFANQCRQKNLRGNTFFLCEAYRWSATACRRQPTWTGRFEYLQQNAQESWQHRHAPHGGWGTLAV